MEKEDSSAVSLGAASPSRGRVAHYVAPLALLLLIGAIVLIVVMTGNSSSSRHRGSSIAGAPIPKNLPPYWTVRAGDTYELIAKQTKLTVAQLEVLNPQADPRTLVPGERLNLRHPGPPPGSAPAGPSHPPWPGPHFFTVRSGDSFGSIAAKTGINITTLLQLNPNKKPSTLQPGDVVRLRPGPDVVVDPAWVHLL